MKKESVKVVGFFFKWRYSSFVNLSAYSSTSFVLSTVCLKILSTSIVSVTSAIYINVQSTGFVATQTMFIYLFCCRFFFFGKMFPSFNATSISSV